MARPAQSLESITAKREEILVAAQQVLEENRTIEAVTLRAVAKVLGWSYSAAYRYFSNKEELLIALRARAFRWMEQELRESIGVSNSSIENLESLAQAYISAGMHRPDLYRMMFFEMSTSQSEFIATELNEAKKECLGVCEKVMVTAQHGGELSVEIDPLTAAHMFWVSAHGIVSLQIADQFVMGRDVNQITHTMVNIVINGLRTPQQSSQFFANGVFNQIESEQEVHTP